MITPLTKLREDLIKNKLDALLISSISNIIYLTHYSGFSRDEREAYIFVTKDSQYILTDGRYTTAIKTLIPDFKLIEISSKLSAGEIIKQLTKEHAVKRLGFEGNDINFLEHKKIKKYFNNIYHLSTSSLRSVKSKNEVSAIEKACKLGDKAFNYILKSIKPGISEKELALELEIFIKKQGADISFRPIVAFGQNSALPHHIPTDKRLATSDKLVLLDFGVKLDNYCSDMTRAVFFGKASGEEKKIYQTVLEAQSKAIEYLKSLTVSHKSIIAKNVDKVARDHIIAKGYPSIPHSLGHGIGIEVHEAQSLSPKSKDLLKEGMVFSVEPGIYLPDLGGVRIEDLVVLTKSGLRLLTHSPKNIIEI